MPNNTTLSLREAGSLILSRPYLLWLEKDVFPYIFGTISLITIILGIIFNIAIFKLFAKEKHVGIRRTIIRFVAIDAFAQIFVLAPGIYISYSKTEDLPQAYCIINGVFSLVAYLIQFGILTFGLATSLITVVRHKEETEYVTKYRHVCFLFCICIVSIVFSMIPVTWRDGFVYRTSEYQCGPNRSVKEAYIHAVFSIGVFVSFILACVLSVVLTKFFLSRNTKVSVIQNTQSQDKITMEDQTGSNDLSVEAEPDIRRNRFKSDETVSIEDQTRSLDISGEDFSDGKCNRFRSDVTVSMEDQTKSYGNVSFKDSTHTGITVSMEDRTRSYSKKCEHSEFNTAISSELTSFVRPSTPTVNFLRVTSTSDESLKTALDILDKDVSAYFDTRKACVKWMDSEEGPLENGHDFPKSQHCTRGSDDQISFDRSYDPEMISCASSVSVRSNTASFRSFAGVTGGKKAFLANLLQSVVIDKNKTLKLATVNVLVSFSVLACWSPFVIMVYIDMYGTMWWEGWLTAAVLCANISYCIKPLIILGIRGQLAQASKAVLPKSVKDRASRITSAVSKTIEKVSKKMHLT